MVDVHILAHDASNNSSLSELALRQQGTAALTLAVAPPAPCDVQSPTRILRLPEVMSRVGLRHAAIYQYMSEGSFPQSIHLGSRAVGWLEHEIEEWLAERIRLRQRYKINRLNKPKERSI